MAWQLVKETFDQQWQDTITGKRGLRVFFVVSSTKILDNDEVLDADDGITAIPLLTAPWSVGQPGVTVTNRRVKELDNGKKLFNVEVEYETPSGSGTDGSDDPDPRDRPWSISTSTYREERNIEFSVLDTTGFSGADINLKSGDAIVNAASDPLELRGVRRKTIITLSKNYASISSIGAGITDLAALKEYEGKMSDSAVTIADLVDDVKWKFLVDEINVANARENEIDYVHVSYRVIFDPLTHIEVLLNAGLNELVDDGGVKKRVGIRDAKGQPIKKPALLSITGAAVAATDPSIGVAAGTYISAASSSEIDLKDLNLPTTFN